MKLLPADSSSDRSKKRKHSHKGKPKQTKRPPEEAWLRIGAFLSLKSENTRTTYRTVVVEWCRFLGGEPDEVETAKKLLKATDLHAIAYKNWLEKRPGQKPRMTTTPKKSSSKEIEVRSKAHTRRDGLQHTQAEATIAKKFAALRRIYRMLMASGFAIKRNPFDVDLVPAPKAQAGRKRPTEMVEFDLVKALLSLPDPEQPKGIRDKAILSVLFGGGLRRSEVCGVRLGDFKSTPKGSSYLVLRATKAQKDAEQVLPPWAGENVAKLVELRKLQGASQGDFLFNSYRGRGGKIPTQDPISADGIYLLFKAYCKQLGLDHASPHSARATAITKLLTDGVSFREVQEFSRHSSVQMVEVYDKRRISVDENPGKDLSYD